MSTATLTDLTGATDPSVPFGNDVNLIDQQLTNLEAANIAHPNSAVQISTTIRWFELSKLGNYGSFDASTFAMESVAISNLLTWKQQTATLTITEMQVSSDKAIKLDGTYYWNIYLQTASSRTGLTPPWCSTHRVPSTKSSLLELACRSLSIGSQGLWHRLEALRMSQRPTSPSPSLASTLRPQHRGRHGSLQVYASHHSQGAGSHRDVESVWERLSPAGGQHSPKWRAFTV